MDNLKTSDGIHIETREAQAWLRRKDKEADASAEQRHAQTMAAATSASRGAWAAVWVTAFLGTAGVLATIWFGLHPSR